METPKEYCTAGVCDSCEYRQECLEAWMRRIDEAYDNDDSRDEIPY